MIDLPVFFQVAYLRSKDTPLPDTVPVYTTPDY